MPTISVDVDVDLDEFDTQDLIDELERRGKELGHRGADCSELLDKIHAALCLNSVDQLIPLARELIYQSSGRVV
ncbi:hypothetical protein [Pseudaeromonas paramecii]|uniref:Uncharacterized protein n=1 Tax=Pseudaeromonas paramecii TaxID=2138166 RepID=A0ABP8PV75_9GAMM